MTRDDIIKLARSDDWAADVSLKWDDFFVRFAAHVAAAEREACAKVCDGFWLNGRYLTDVADSIRARGETK